MNHANDLYECRLHQTRQRHPTAAAARAAVLAFAQAHAATGWLCTPGAVCALSPDRPLSDPAPLLSGELVGRDGKRSLTLRYLNPEEGWQTVELFEEEGDEVLAVTETVLAIHPDLKGTAAAGRRSRYTTYWPRTVDVDQTQPCPQPGPIASRLVKFAFEIKEGQ